jgi:REP element-mobilizing transposase RayT
VTEGYNWKHVPLAAPGPIGSLFLHYLSALPKRKTLAEPEFACLARVIHERREEHGFLVTAWVLLPDHWHAILFPRHPLTISEVMESIKVSSTRRIN